MEVKEINNTVKNREYNGLAFLNIFRLFFAVSIVLWHYPIQNLGNIDQRPFLKFLRNMTICGGNQVFFLISGMMFCIAYYKRLVEGKVTSGKFILGRIKRLYPLAMFATLLCFSVPLFTVLRSGTGSVNIQRLLEDLFLFGRSLFGWDYSTYNGPIWYLAALMVCYLTCVVLLPPVKKGGAKWYLVPLVIGFYISNKSVSLPILNNGQFGIGLYNFFLGFFLMLFLRKLEIAPTAVRVSIKSLCLVFSFLMLRLFVKQNYSCDYFGSCDIAFNIPIWMPLFTGLYGLQINRLLDNKVCKFLGAMSFHIFVYHTFFNRLFGVLTPKIAFLAENPFGCFWIYFGCLFILSILSTVFFYPLFDRLIGTVKGWFSSTSEKV